jgi:hypothetical protein
MPKSPKKDLNTNVRSFFGRPTKQKTNQKAKQFLFEERAALLARLLELKYSAKKDRRWADEVENCLSDSPLSAAIGKSLSATDKAENFEAQTNDAIDAALKLVERHPIAAFGRDTNGLITEAVDIAVQKSTPARALRWGAPALIAAIVGGTVVWGFKLDGLEKSRKEVEEKLDKARDGAETVIIKFQQSLDKESKTRLEELTSLVEGAKGRVKTAINAEMDSLPKFFGDEKNGLTQNGNDALAQVVAGLNAYSETKKKEINGAIGELGEKIKSASGETDAPGKIEEFKTAVRDLENQIKETKALAGEVRNLRVMLETTSGATRLTAAQVLRIFELKDSTAIGAAILSLLALVLSISAFRRARRPSSGNG